LKAIPDQDIFYDVTDALEEQGLEKIIQFHVNQKSADRDLIDQFRLYEAVLRHEDGLKDTDVMNQMDNMR
jgi:FH1/FH2 domain-containing protein 1